MAVGRGSKPRSACRPPVQHQASGPKLWGDREVAGKGLQRGQLVRFCPDLGVTWFVHFVRIHHTIDPCALFCVCYT